MLSRSRSLGGFFLVGRRSVVSDPIKKKDYWAWYCSQFLPAPVSKANNIFYALHHELINPESQVRQNQVTSPEGSPSQAKAIRVQWWKDEINKAMLIASRIKEKGDFDKGEIPSHPVLQALFSLIIQDIKLSKTFFASLFRAHSDQTLPYSVEDVERYGKDSIGSILGLTLECYWKMDSKITHAQKMDIEHAAIHMATALSIFQLLRATPLHISRRVCFLPIKLLSQHKVSTEDLYRGKAKMDDFSEVIYEVASAAHIHLEHCEKLRQKDTQLLKEFFLPSIIVKDYLTDLQKCHFDIYSKKLKTNKPLAWQTSLLWNYYKN